MKLKNKKKKQTVDVIFAESVFVYTTKFIDDTKIYFFFGIFEKFISNL